jgi:hypothetical protein
MSQLNLSFDQGRALARRSDPVTSKLAASEILPRLKKLNVVIADLVAQHPGLTGRELADLFCPTNPERLRKRLAGIAEGGRR